MTAYPTRFPSSCLFRRDTIKMHLSVSSDLSFFLPPPWPVTDSSVQSINLSLPQSGTVLLFFSHVWTERRTHNIPRLWVCHTKWDKHLVLGREKPEVKSICSLSAIHWSPVIGWPLINPANETPVLHLNTKSATLQLGLITVEESTYRQLTGGLKCLFTQSF